mmetsp:Transcript_13973/g.30430  ORF Transcript_13973/g.30430 Transcript_13973/m.30430 type:complete len:478 (-) Transcript_13973:524-1957(-)|eukprot:CAMPEP_0172326224 /NCGR_PEP_ID=MMETSP1058-20130122/55905_1 /TAXON_ID=83371 /ORGANISM="Detonula confervacea, Strain CCMP 353" /LENGTH=477 /DNA_ID=CAMNT_0013042953 /DNA_START=82 /DNA_END=1518 /DNA_ORIENTATION=+
MGKVKQRRSPKENASREGDGTADKTPSRQKVSKQPAVNNKRNVNRGAHQHQPAYANSDPGILSLSIYLIKVLLLTLLSMPFWFLTGILSLLYGRPPKMVFPSQTWRYLRYTIECKEDLSFSARLDLMMTIILHSVTSPVSGFCWLVDEILYGKQLNSMNIVKPLFVLSAYRSASTEMARTLAKDTQRFVAPNAIMCAFPYLWLWKLITCIVGDDSGISKEEANGYLNKNFSKESLERHDNDHFAIDTFDGYFLSSHLNGVAFQLGPDVIVKEFNSAQSEEHNQYLFEYCFVEHVDRIARKALLFNGATCSSRDRSFLLKGHFLLSAGALQRKYPDARFLTVLRDPLDRLRSGINHMAVNATLWQGKSPRWDWLSVAFQQIEVAYCEREMEWYNDGSVDVHKCRLAVKFNRLIDDFHKTMKGVYRYLLESKESEVPHYALPSKVSKHYTVNQSLKELGVDEAEFKRQLVDYYAWMKKR